MAPGTAAPARAAGSRRFWSAKGRETEGRRKGQIKAVLVHGHTVSTGVTTENWRERTEGGRRGRRASKFDTKCTGSLYTHHGSTQNLDSLAAAYLGLVRYGSMVNRGRYFAKM